MIFPVSYSITYNSPWDELFLCPFSMWKIHVGIILLPFQFEENTSQFDIFLILYELMKSKKRFLQYAYNDTISICVPLYVRCKWPSWENYFTCECALFNNNSIEEFLLDAKTIY